MIDSAILQTKSGIPGLRWPPVPAAANAQLLALVQWLDRSQWLNAAALQAGQLAQLALLLKHFERQSPWWQQRLRDSGQATQAVCQSIHAFAQLPVTTRGDVQRAGETLHSQVVPTAHLPKFAKKTSGSTGEPVQVYRTALNHLFWQACTVREHLWHGRDPGARLAVARQNLSQPFARPDWGAPVGNLFATGPSCGMPLTTDVQVLLEWLLRIQPNYLLIYPSVWQAILALLPDGQGLASLTQVRTIGETVGADLRHQTRQKLGIPIVDTYSSEEVGIIAIQCPQSGLYHTIAESLLVEVLAEDGTPCIVGEVGRVVVTDLMNFASPIIRYDIGDYAELGPVCSCGRSLPTLRRILGRLRNMVKLPGSKSNWPLTGFREFSTVANVTQYQFVQKSLELMEVRLVVGGGALTQEQETALAEIAGRSLGRSFTYQFIYFADRIPKPLSGKFEEFVCEI